jgi:UDP-galactopyranose mutase
MLSEADRGGIPLARTLSEAYDMMSVGVLCFSHLRWNFVFQRPNHLMSRCAADRRVLFIEEPLFDASEPTLETETVVENLTRVVPHLLPGTTRADEIATIRDLLTGLVARLGLEQCVHWFYTPMMLPYAEGLPRQLAVYDCMDELSHFLNAPTELTERERELMAIADVMFTGGMALYEAKRGKHANVHGIPSSVDVAFFKQARAQLTDPADQAGIAHPRLGYVGVIDERLDLALLEESARARPDYQFVMIGPVVKIDPAKLPKLPNIHYLGGKQYAELPSYVAGWDAAIMPFALNDATRFISPTKTPEYLAAGRRVVSTAIADVVEPYERLGFVRIGRSNQDFVEQLDRALADDEQLDAARDEWLAGNSWDATWARMWRLVAEAQERRDSARSSGIVPTSERGLHV